jgi:hypothetical protein
MRRQPVNISRRLDMSGHVILIVGGLAVRAVLETVTVGIVLFIAERRWVLAHGVLLAVDGLVTMPSMHPVSCPDPFGSQHFQRHLG